MKAHQTLFTYDGDDTDELNQVHMGTYLAGWKVKHPSDFFCFMVPKGDQLPTFFLDEKPIRFYDQSERFSLRLRMI